MKKPLDCILAILIFSLLIPLNIFAIDNGDMVGEVYAGNINAYVDGIPISSYYFNGKTGIVCEELRSYGFNVDWNEYKRCLSVNTVLTRSQMNNILPPEDADILIGDEGEAVGSIYVTDITTYVNGKVIPSYNLGGSTLILLEDLGLEYGFNISHDEAGGTISAMPYREGDRIQTDFADFSITGLTIRNIFSFPSRVYEGNLSLDDRKVRLGGEVLLNSFQYYVPLKSTLDAFGVEYHWDNEKNTLKIVSSEKSITNADTQSLTNQSLNDSDMIPSSVTTLHGEAVQDENQDLGEDNDDILYKIDFTVEINGKEYPIIGSKKGLLVQSRRNETPVVYKGVVYFPTDALADYFSLIYRDRARYLTKKDVPETWYEISKFILTPFENDDNKLSSWIAYTKPENRIVPGGGAWLEPYGKSQPIVIKFNLPMDKSTLNEKNIPVIWRQIKGGAEFHYEIISGRYEYVYNETENTLTITPVGEGVQTDVGAITGNSVVVFIKNIADKEGNRLEGIYKLYFRPVE